MQIKHAFAPLALVALLAGCGAAANKPAAPAAPPLPKIVNVPGPTVYRLPAGCGDALVAYEKAVNAYGKNAQAYGQAEMAAWAAQGNGTLGQSEVDAVKGPSDAAAVLFDALNSADKAVANACFTSGS